MNGKCLQEDAFRGCLFLKKKIVFCDFLKKILLEINFFLFLDC